MAADGGPVTPKYLISFWPLVSTMTPPTAVPSRAGLTRVTSHAANGAAMIPPTARPTTIGRLSRNSSRSPTRKPSDADTATRNSEALTEPITVAAPSCPETTTCSWSPDPATAAGRVDEPTEQAKRRKKLRGVRGMGDSTRVACRRRSGPGRSMPIASRMAAMSGAASSVDSDEAGRWRPGTRRWRPAHRAWPRSTSRCS